MMVSDFIYWDQHASIISSTDNRTWHRQHQLDECAGLLTSCLSCGKPYPLPGRIAPELWAKRSWIHYREWRGPTDKGLPISGCACLACATELLHDAEFFNKIAIPLHVEAQLTNQSDSAQT